MGRLGVAPFENYSDEVRVCAARWSAAPTPMRSISPTWNGRVATSALVWRLRMRRRSTALTRPSGRGSIARRIDRSGAGAAPTVSAHALLSRRRRDHDIILSAPFALSPSNFAIFNHRPFDGKVKSSAFKKEGPAPTPWARGETTRWEAYELRGQAASGPASIWTSIHRNGGDTLAPRMCPTRTSRDPAAAQRYTGTLSGVLSHEPWRGPVDGYGSG